jgi:hypothetical protein
MYTEKFRNYVPRYCVQIVIKYRIWISFYGWQVNFVITYNEKILIFKRYIFIKYMH